MFAPDFFPNSIVEALRPDPKIEPFDDFADASVWSTEGRSASIEPVTFDLIGHIDGVEMFKNSVVSSVKPILNKISRIRNSKRQIRIPHTMPVFLTGKFLLNHS